MPFYIVQYIRIKKLASKSVGTMNRYLHDYKRFFDWLRQEGFTEAASNKVVPHSVLEQLQKKDIELFIELLAGDSAEDEQ